MTSATEYYQRAVKLFDERQYESAAAHAHAGLAEYPQEPRLLQVLGTARCNMRDYDLACIALEEASIHMPLHPLAQYALATCYFRFDLIDLAVMIFEHLAESVRNTDLLSAVAARLGEMKMHEEALGVCERIVSLDPNQHQALFGMAYFMCRLDYPARVMVPPLTRALHLAPEVLHYRLNLADTWAKVGNFRSAYELLEPIDIEKVNCACWLRLMEWVFIESNDIGRTLTCQRALQRRRLPSTQ